MTNNVYRVVLNHFEKVTSLLLAVSLVFSALLFSACSTEEFNVYTGVDKLPENLDPVKAQSIGEMTVARNCFRGLFKETADGSAVLDIATDYSVSENGLEYTFTLGEAKWNNGDRVTADDFVFSLMRATDPSTECPSVGLLQNIEGAAERLSGNTDNTLGVTAITDDTLSIKLISRDDGFVKILTTAVFKPCNRKFFEECGGKYGLGKDHIMTNGAYFVASWSEGRNVKLSLADRDTYKTAPKNVYITVSTTGKSSIKRIKDREISLTVNGTEDYSDVDTSVYTVNAVYDRSYAIVFNKSSEIGKNETLTAAFAKAVDRDGYSADMSRRWKTASSIFPSDITVGHTVLDHDIAARHPYLYGYDPSAARSEFMAAVKAFKNSKLPEISVLTADNAELKGVVSNIVSTWQCQLGAYVNITSVSSEEELLKRVESGNYTVAFIPLRGTADGILSKFSDASSGLYRNNSELDSAAAPGFYKDNGEPDTECIEKCLNILSTDSSLIPIILAPTAYIYESKLQNVAFSLNDGSVDFSTISKK